MKEIEAICKEAIDILLEIMRDKEALPSDRLNAANKILEIAIQSGYQPNLKSNSSNEEVNDTKPKHQHTSRPRV